MDAKDGEDREPIAGDEGTAPADAASAQDDGSADQPVLSGSGSARAFAVRDAADHVDSHRTVTAGQPTRAGRQQVQTVSIAAEVDAPSTYSLAPSADALTSAPTTLKVVAAATAVPAPSQPLERPTSVRVLSDLLAVVLQPTLGPANGPPSQMPILSAVLFAVRDEFERILVPPNQNRAPQPGVGRVTNSSEQLSPVVDPTQQHVLVIAVDGANLSRILADPENENFLELMETSTTGPSSIVGHTTISNPSWTAILTGVWGERTGVVNNVFTPWTYNTWPTVFNQLESIDRDIQTMAVGNWDVVNAIAGAGSIPADENVYIHQIAGDTNWLATDDAVADRTVDAISGVNGPTPNFLFSYFVGVDENGHMYGGGSPEYAEALRNMDDNLGEIMDAVAAREAATGEDWTIIVVTDHGHTAQLGLGHGFQSPDETATFVMADGPDFQDGVINLQYEIVDTTPTVVSLFGGTPRAGSDGVPLMTFSGSDVDPVDLKQALQAAIAMNGYPDVVTNVALGLRTIVTSVPYAVFTYGNEFVAALPSFLSGPAQFIVDGLYVVTNVPAQIVAFLTGVSGASIFPLLPPERPVFPPTEGATLPDSVILVGCGVPGAAAESSCGERNVA